MCKAFECIALYICYSQTEQRVTMAEVLLIVGSGAQVVLAATDDGWAGVLPEDCSETTLRHGRKLIVGGCTLPWHEWTYRVADAESGRVAVRVLQRGRSPWTVEDVLRAAPAPGLVAAVLAADAEAPALHYVGLARLGLLNGASMPVTPDTVFEFGSVTKPLVVTAACKQLGGAFFDQPVDLEAFGVAPTRGQPRVWHLATHTSGLPNAIPELAVARNAPRSICHWVRESAHAGTPIEQVAPPGVAFRYSNLNIAILAQMAFEQLCKPFPALRAGPCWRPAAPEDVQAGVRFLEKYVLPVFCPAAAVIDAPVAAKADGHSVATSGDFMPLPFVETQNLLNYDIVNLLGAAGGIVGRAADAAAVLLAVARPVDDDGKLADALRVTMEPRVPIQEPDSWSGPFAAALGWRVFERLTPAGAPLALVGHNGATIGFSAALRVDPAGGAGFFVLSNANNFGTEDHRDYERLVDLLVEVLYGPPPAPPRWPREGAYTAQNFLRGGDTDELRVAGARCELFVAGERAPRSCHLLEPAGVVADTGALRFRMRPDTTYPRIRGNSDMDNTFLYATPDALHLHGAHFLHI